MEAIHMVKYGHIEGLRDVLGEIAKTMKSIKKLQVRGLTSEMNASMLEILTLWALISR